MKKLGCNQKGVMDALRDHGPWQKIYPCGWIWDTRSGTIKILDSLVKRGLVVEKAGRYSLANKLTEQDYSDLMGS